MTYLQRYRPPSNEVVSYSVIVNDPMQDARNAGECLNLRLFLQVHETALAYFISDLESRAAECRLEKDFSFVKARRQRQAIDEAIQRYRRMTSPIPPAIASTSARQRTAELIGAFLVSLYPVLPSINTADIAEGNGLEGDWKVRLDQAAKIVDELTGNVKPVHAELLAILHEKSAISHQIELSLRQMSDIF